MYFTVNLKDIKNATKSAIRGISKKAENKDLLNFKLEAKDSKLQIIAINEYFFMRIEIEADIVEEGTIFVDAKLLEDILKNIKGKSSLTCKKEGNYLEVKYENSTFNIRTETVNDYPDFPEYEEEAWYRIEATELTESTKQVGFSISNNEEKPILENVLIKTHDNMLDMVSSDGYRISNKRKMLESCSKDESILIKGDSFVELGRVLANYKKGEIAIGISNKYMIVNLPNGVMLITLMSGEYFNHQNFFKTKDFNRVAFDKEKMLEVLKKGKSLAKGLKDKNPVVKLDITNDGIKLSVNIDESNISEVLESNVLTDDFHGEIVSFNLDYLNEGISSIQSDRVIMYFNKNNTPSIFEGLDNKEYKYMIMPIIKPNH